MKNNDFSEDIILKPYLKYKYQSVLKGPKPIVKEVFLKAINGFNSEHLYFINPFKKRGYCLYYPKKSNLRPQKEQEFKKFEFQRKFLLN
jgi:hypothetical protein